MIEISLAKHKKKKSEPTPDPKDSTNNIKNEGNDIPETENTTESSAPDPRETIQNDDKTEKDKKLNKLFWLRVGFAVVAGVAATFIFDSIEGEDRRWASIAFMIVIFIVTIGIAKGMKIPLPSSDRKKIVTQGIGSYIFIYLFMWIVSYTLVNVETVTSIISSPIP